MDTLRNPPQNALSDTPGLRLAFLFGSHAYGHPRPDRDTDLGVLAALVSPYGQRCGFPAAA